MRRRREKEEEENEGSQHSKAHPLSFELLFGEKSGSAAAWNSRNDSQKDDQQYPWNVSQRVHRVRQRENSQTDETRERGETTISRCQRSPKE